MAFENIHGNIDAPDNLTPSIPTQPENRPDPIAEWKMRAINAELLEKEKSRNILKSKGYKIEDNDARNDAEKIELSEQGMESLGCIKDVKTRWFKRKQSLEERGEVRELNIKDSEWFGNVMGFIKMHENEPEVIELYWKEYDKLFGGMKVEDGSLYNKNTKNSILGSLATINFLEKTLKYKVNLAEPNIDVDYKIDAWIDTEDKDGGKVKIAIQFFSKDWGSLMPEDQIFLSENGMVQFFNEEDLNIKDNEFAKTKFANELEDKIKKTKRGCIKFIEDHEKEIGDTKFMLMFITMPMGIEKTKPIISENGNLLNKAKEERLCEQFEHGFKEKINNVEFI